MASQGVDEISENAPSLDLGLQNVLVEPQTGTRPPTAKTLNEDEEKGVDILSDEKAPVADVFIIPDGGWRAWSVVVGCFLVLFSTFGYVSIAIFSQNKLHSERWSITG